MRYIQFKQASASRLHPLVSVCGPLVHSTGDRAFILWSGLGSLYTVMKYKSVSVIHQLWQSIFRSKHLCLAVIPLSFHPPLYLLLIFPYGDNTLLMNTNYKTDRSRLFPAPRHAGDNMRLSIERAR